MATLQEEFKQFKEEKATGVTGEFEKFKTTQRAQAEIFKAMQALQGTTKQVTPISQVPSLEEQKKLTQFGPTKGIFEGFPVGATAGATAGTAIAGFPIGTIGGTIAGESIQQLAEIAEQRRLVEDVPFVSGKRAPSGALETTKRVGRSVFEQLLGEGLFRGPAALARGPAKRVVTAPFAKSLTPKQRSAAELLASENIPFTPFDIQQRVITGRLEKFAEQAFGSGGIMRRFNDRKVQAVAAFVDRELGRVGLKKTRAQTGRLAQSAINDTFDNLNESATAAFTQAAREAGTEPLIPTATIKNRANEILDLEKLLKIPKVTKEDTGILSEFGKQIFKEVKTLKRTELNFKQLEGLADDLLQLPDNITFEQARAFQQRLGARIAKLKGLPEGEAKILFKGFAEAVEQLPNPTALESLDRGKELFKRSLDLSRETSLGKLRGKSPEEIFRTVFKPKNVTEIEQLRSIIPASDWNIFQRQFADEILEQAGPNFRGLDKTLRKFSDETLNATLNKEQVEFFQKLSTIVRTTRLPEVAKGLEVRPGVGLIQIVRGRMALNVIAGKTKKGVLTRLSSGGTLFLGPPAITKVLTSKGGAKLLTTGLTLKASHPRAADIIRQIIDIVGGTATRASVAGRIETEDLEQRQPRGILSALGGR